MTVAPANLAAVHRFLENSGETADAVAVLRLAISLVTPLLLRVAFRKTQ